MNLSLLAGCIWLITANVIAMFPSRDHHWRNAHMLITLGIPLLLWITTQNGPLPALLFVAGGASILRWPLYFLARRAKSLIQRPPVEQPCLPTMSALPLGSHSRKKASKNR